MGGKFYIDGNFVAGYPDVTADNWTKGVQKDSYANAEVLIKAARQEKPFDTAPVRTHTAEEAYLRVLDSAGAILPRRDPIDIRITRETRTGTATYEGATYARVTGTGISHPSGIIDSPANVGGIPKYGSNTAYTDADKDGMDDTWELTNGLNPKMLQMAIISLQMDTPNSKIFSIVSLKIQGLAKLQVGQKR